ncbi:unnamed protein product, partial [Musa acuminata subsp. burmannicoides]
AEFWVIFGRYVLGIAVWLSQQSGGGAAAARVCYVLVFPEQLRVDAAAATAAAHAEFYMK